MSFVYEIPKRRKEHQRRVCVCVYVYIYLCSKMRKGWIRRCSSFVYAVWAYKGHEAWTVIMAVLNRSVRFITQYHHKTAVNYFRTRA